MSEQRDSVIKLFGKTIPLIKLNQRPLSDDEPSSAPAAVLFDHNFLSDEGTPVQVSGKQDKEFSQKEVTEDKQEESTSNQILEDSKYPTTSSGISQNPNTSSADRETSSLKNSKKGELSETSSSQDKTLKKPDRILPCPRCDSMDTKFCYYNNYNVNQPRHFCKNCQRYWTAGGSMRNVPVGAGRRKNKSSSNSHHHDISISEALRAAQASATNGGLYGGHILTFGSDSPLCESVASVLKLSQKTQNCIRNGLRRPEPKVVSTSGGTHNGDDQTSGSSFTSSNVSDKGGNCGTEAAAKHFPGFPQICLPTAPWPYPWNSALPLPPPTLYPPGFPVSFYPTPAYWGYNVAPSWNASSPCSVIHHTSNPASPILGKHSRDENNPSPSNSEKEQPSRQTSNSERNVLVLKTSKIDDPGEAAKSSIWTTLGITSDKTNSISAGTLFNGFQVKTDDGNHKADKSPVLQANPAAMSRSINFHEST